MPLGVNPKRLSRSTSGLPDPSLQFRGMDEFFVSSPGRPGQTSIISEGVILVALVNVPRVRAFCARIPANAPSGGSSDSSNTFEPEVRSHGYATCRNALDILGADIL